MIRRGIAALFISLLVIPPGSAEAENGGPIATILCYHVVDSPSDTHFSISREQFKRQIRYLTSAGYNVIPLADLVRYYRGEIKSLPERAVVITVDDGWKCTYEIIYEELSRREIPFTALLYPKFIIGGSYSLSWDEVREMARNGVDIQSHTLSHAHLTKAKSGRNGAGYQSWLADELRESKKVLEEKLGKTVDVLAYPYGDYDDTVLAATKEAGYSAALTCNFGSVSAETDPFRLYRVVIDREMSFEEFRSHLGANMLELTDLRPLPGQIWNPSYPVVAARIAEPDSIDPSSVQMTLLDGRDAPFFYDPRDGSISLVLKDEFTEQEKAVLISAREIEGGRRVEASWMFRRPAATTDEPNGAIAENREADEISSTATGGSWK